MYNLHKSQLYHCTTIYHGATEGIYNIGQWTLSLKSHGQTEIIRQFCQRSCHPMQRHQFYKATQVDLRFAPSWVIVTTILWSAPVTTEATLPKPMGSFHLPTHVQLVEANVKAGLHLLRDSLLICGKIHLLSTLRSMSLPGILANGTGVIDHSR